MYRSLDLVRQAIAALPDGELAAKVNEYAGELKNKAYYFISGPPGMARSVAMILDDLFIFEGRIVVEAFTGYA